jgi:hypothetical protein
MSEANLFQPSRAEVRQFFCEAWRKHCTGDVLTPLESVAAHWIAEHPEYHALLSSAPYAQPDGKRRTEHEHPVSQPEHSDVESGQSNPFLHLSMHLAISEQLSIDQPAGIRAIYTRLLERLGTPHAAQHVVMECLGQVLWEAQRNGTPPDTAAYLAALQRQASQASNA